MIEANGPEIAHLASLGLVETYRRTHTGQGTQNVCYGFDNLFLELLWVNDPHAARSEAITRTGLYERSLWRTQGTCPFGIAWRRSQASPALLLPTWEFKPPYLPKGMSIPVATDSDDPRQPLIFESPGSTSPIEWPIEKRGYLQHPAGLGSVAEIRLTMPADSPPSGALASLARTETPPFSIDAPGPYRLRLRIASIKNNLDLQITLPPPSACPPTSTAPAAYPHPSRPGSAPPPAPLSQTPPAPRANRSAPPGSAPQ